MGPYRVGCAPRSTCAQIIAGDGVRSGLHNIRFDAVAACVFPNVARAHPSPVGEGLFL